MLAAHPPNSWGIDVPVHQGNPGVAPTRFTAPPYLAPEPHPSNGGGGGEAQTCLLNPKLPIPLVG